MDSIEICRERKPISLSKEKTNFQPEYEYSLDGKYRSYVDDKNQRVLEEIHAEVISAEEIVPACSIVSDHPEEGLSYESQKLLDDATNKELIDKFKKAGFKDSEFVVREFRRYARKSIHVGMKFAILELFLAIASAYGELPFSIATSTAIINSSFAIYLMGSAGTSIFKIIMHSKTNLSFDGLEKLKLSLNTVINESVDKILSFSLEIYSLIKDIITDFSNNKKQRNWTDDDDDKG